MISFTKLLFFANTSFLSCFSLILMSSSDISVRGNAFTWQRKSWIIFSPSWKGGRRKRKQKGCLDCEQDFSKFPKDTKYYSSPETFCRQKPELFLHLLSRSQHQNNPVMLVSRVLSPFNLWAKTISRNTVFNIESSYVFHINSSMQPCEARISSNNSIRVAIFPKLVNFWRNRTSKPTFQYANGKNKL